MSVIAIHFLNGTSLSSRLPFDSRPFCSYLSPSFYDLRSTEAAGAALPPRDAPPRKKINKKSIIIIYAPLFRPKAFRRGSVSRYPRLCRSACLASPKVAPIARRSSPRILQLPGKIPLPLPLRLPLRKNPSYPRAMTPATSAPRRAPVARPGRRRCRVAPGEGAPHTSTWASHRRHPPPPRHA